MNRLLLSVSVTSLLWITGCTSGGVAGMSDAERNFGSAPTPASNQALFLGYLSANLKDPGSALISQYAGPSKFAGSSGIFSIGGHGWGSCYSVNAKNSFGGYTGSRVYLSIVRNDRLVEVARAGETIYQDQEISNFCAQAVKVKPITLTGAYVREPERITPELLASFKPGVTSRKDAESAFGAPTSVTPMAKLILLQWISPSNRAHVAITFEEDNGQMMKQVTHSFFQ